MAYKKGEVKFGNVTDTQTEDYDDGKWFYLPHSCDAWVIGGKEEVKHLIEDLQALLQDKNK